MLKSETIDGAAPYLAQNVTSPTEMLLEERAKNWGNPVLTHARIAEVWSGILNTEITSHQVALCLVGLKLVRAAINPDEADSLEDAAGYTRIGQLIMGAGR